MDQCPVCEGSGKLLAERCPLCEGDAAFWKDEEAENEVKEPEAKPKKTQWWINLGADENPHWVKFDEAVNQEMVEAEGRGETEIKYSARGQDYRVNLQILMQVNERTMMARMIKRTEEENDGEKYDNRQDEGSEESEDEAPPFWMHRQSPMQQGIATPERTERQQRLVEALLSGAAQVPLPAAAEEEPAKLSDEEVKEVFKEHVKGVESFLFRDMCGQYSLDFMVTAYKAGLRAFQDTDMHEHLMWLMRKVVHNGHEKKPGCVRYLSEVAEAFKDCQAVQARVVERCGLEILGVSKDFIGLVTEILGNEKTMALKMLAQYHIARGWISDDGNPTHYENRLTADIGKDLGLNQDDIRRADLDGHAANRFARLTGDKHSTALVDFRKLFDLDAFVKMLTDEINRHDENSPKDSLPCQFVAWADDSMRHKHIIFDDSCLRVEVEKPLVVAVLEGVFTGKVDWQDESYREHSLNDMFHPSVAEKAAERTAKLAGATKNDSKGDDGKGEDGKGKDGKGGKGGNDNNDKGKGGGYTNAQDNSKGGKGNCAQDKSKGKGTQGKQGKKSR